MYVLLAFGVVFFFFFPDTTTLDFVKVYILT
jgi:hypothetical protein